MARLAEIDGNNIVVNIESVSDDPDKQSAYIAAFPGKTFIPLGVVVAGTVNIGNVYDQNAHACYPPQPFPSWTLNQDTWTWEPPIAHPGGLAVWNEEQQNWVTE
ncbi:MAG: hypothetical protein HQL90_04265 [Magnetococcales bacterium]|nr:hypothetical protein [Magnetococcales bacterium]